MKKIYFFLLLTMLIGFSSLQLSAQQTLTVHNGTATNGYVPVYGYYADAYLKAEFVYPAFELTAIANSNDPIISLTFYAAQDNVSWGSANFQVFLTEITETSLSSYIGNSNATIVYQGPLSISGGEMEIEFTTPYTYNGGNLLIGVYNTVEGSYVSSSWYGEEVNGASIQGNSYSDLSSISAFQRNFLPKTTFTYGLVTCAKPTAFDATIVNTTEVMLNWNGNGSSSTYNVEYGATGFTPGVGTGTTEIVYDTTINISGLTEGVTYDYYVQADCGADGTSIWVGPITLNTSQINMATMGSDTITTCGLVIYDNGGPTDNYSNNCNSILVLYPATPNAVIAITGTNSSESNYDYLRIFDGVGTNGTRLVNSNGSGQTINAISSTGPLTIQFTSDGSSNYAGFELLVSCITCYAPSNIAATNVTTDEATLNWVGPSATSSYLVYVNNGTNTDIYEVYGETTDLYSLTPATNYTVQIQTLCDDGDTSMLSSAYHFNTACAAIDITETTPWVENFEGYAGGGEQPFICWETPVTDATYHGPFVYCGHSPSCHSGSNSAELKGASNMLILPEFSNDINTLRLTFWATAVPHPTTGTLEIGVVTDMTDPVNSFVFVANSGEPGPRGGSGSTGNGNYMGPFDFNGAQVTTGRIALRYTNSATASASWNLDDFTVSIIPACNAPVVTSVEATNVLGHSATISWTDGDNSHSAWMVYYKANGDNDWQTTSASATTVELTGLDPETTYQAYVVTVCDGVEGTDATLTINFTTDVACPAPSDITASNVTTNSATISWLGEANSYTVEYDTTGFTQGSGTIVSNLTTTTFDLSNLEGNTSYTIYIFGDCGTEDGLSDIASYTFRTACDAISVTSTPWIEGFENSVDDPECWVSALTATRNNHTFPHIEPTASIAHGGSKALEIAFGDIVTALPQFDVNLSDLMLTFWAYNNRYSSNYNTVLELGYITNPYDTSTFVPTDTYTYTTYTQVIKSFSNLADLNLPSTTRIAFRYRQQASSNLTSWYIDDMTVELIPDCMHPTNLHATNVGETEVTLAWTEMGTATGWNIEYGTTEFTPGQSIGTEVFADANPYTIDNLIGGTAYHFYVQADCGSTWEGPFTVIPGQYVMNATGSDTLTTCGMVIYDNGGANGQYSNSCNSTLVLYPANPDAKLSLTGTATTESGWDYLYVYDGVGTDGDYIARYHGNNQVVNVLSTTGPLTVKFTSDASGQRDGFELIVQCVTCYPPTNFTASDVSLDEATISWSGNADGYGVYVILSDTTYYTTTDTFLTLSNLMPSSSYRVYVRSLCGGDSSALSPAFNFSTSCGQITIDETTPWFEDFEGYGNSGGAVPVGACWATPETYAVSNGTSPFVYLNYSGSAYSGENTLEMKGGPTMVVLPEFSNDINTLRISMWGNTTASNASGAGTMALGYISDITNPATFVAIDTIPATAFNRTGNDSPHADFIGPYDFSGVTPQAGLRIALRLTDIGTLSWSTDPHSWNLDDITVSLIPGCPSPVKTSVTATNVDGHNATISWVDHDATHDSWTVFYKADNETSWQSIVAGPTPSTDLNNLDPETTYEVYVITNCTTPDQVTDETNHIHFTTTIACPAPTALAVSNVGMTSATVTWNGTAGSYIIEYGESGFTPGSGTTETANANTIVLTGLTSGTAYTVYVTADCGSIDGISSAATTNFSTSICDVTDQCSYTFSLADSFGDGWNGASITVQQNGITVATLGITSGYSATETVPLCDNESTSLIWHSGSYDSECSFTVTGPDGTEIYATSGTPSGTLTTFTTNCNGSTPPPTCNVPTNLNATATTYNTANVTWTAIGTETSWNLQYRTGTANWTTLPVNATTYQITGLAAQTTYEVRVQANCGDATSDWTAAVSFTTPAAPADPCNAPTNLQVNSITQTSATMTWTAGGTETSWKVGYKLSTASQWQEATVNTTSYDMTGLTANSTYDVRVKAICAADNQSDFVTGTFTTEGVGIDNITLANSINLMPNPADNYIELRVNSNVEVKEAVVYNAFGQMIQTVELTENHARIDLSNMAAGMYFVRVNGEGVSATKKFIKR